MKHHFSISLTVQGPILTKSSSPSGFGVDAAVARVTHGPQRDQPCIPGTHIEGKVREAWGQLGYDDQNIIRLLGLKSPEGTDDLPVRGRLQIGDLIATSKGKSRITRHRIALEQELGSVKHGALQVIETPYAAGETVTFTGKAWAYGEDAKALREQLQLGLSFLTHIGSGRSIGLGRLLEVAVTPLEAQSTKPTSGLGSPLTLHLKLQPQGPLCISKHKMDENLYASEDFIPGNMVAGALVETWAATLGLRPGSSASQCAEKDPARALLARHFDELRFRHAFPAPSDKSRPKAIPLSWVKSGDKPYDVASLPAAKLLPNSKGELLSPAFLLDWKGKDFEKANAACGRHSPSRELRVRTSIDSRKRTVDRGENDEGGKLFAWELIHPEADDDANTPLVWHGAIDLSAVKNAEERAAVAHQLDSLLADLGFVSKTKAHCPTLVAAAEAEAASSLSTNSPLHLVLQTPALLVDPRFQNLPGLPTHGAVDATAMTALYRQVWHDLSGGNLELTHHFSRQQLAGGPYLAARYQKGKAYNPWLLTTEGSVFAFKVINAEKAAACLTVWLETGLPLPQWAEDKWGDSWRTNPFLPQNGFGEIAVHQTHPNFPLPTP